VIDKLVSKKRLVPLFAVVLGWAMCARGLEPLTSIEAIRALPKAEASRALPVAIEATVTYYHPDFRYLFVQDGDQAIFVYAPAGTQLAAGDRVLVKGVTHAEFNPDILSDSITVLSHGSVPKPLPVDFDELMSGKLDCRYVTIRGKVRAANLVLRPDVRNSITLTRHVAYLEVATDGGYVEVIVNSTDERLFNDLLDADVEITGAAGGKYDGKWHQTGVVIRAMSFASVKILKRASASVWSLPVTSMDQVLTGYHVQDLSKRVRVRGTITYFQPGYDRLGSAIVLENRNQSLWVESQTDQPLRIGDLADVTGFPGVASGSPTLTHAQVRDLGTPAPVAPLKVAWWQLADANMAGKHHYDLVTIEGQVVMQTRGALQDEYVLVHDGELFSAIFHHPPPTSQLPIPPMREIPVGSRVQVTGICILQDSTLFTGEAPFDILLRSFDDVQVVAKPSWLSIRNLMLVVGMLVLIVMVVSAWGWTLERKVRQQSSAITAQIEAEATLERRRSRILEDINEIKPLAGILEQIVELTSYRLEGAPCWCDVTGGARLGDHPRETKGLRVIEAEIPARSGPGLGRIFVGMPAGTQPHAGEVEALAVGARLATLAIETRRLYADLLHRSEFDLLTDIHNRFSLETRLAAQIEHARDNATSFGLIYIDLDEFKQINDQFGHQVGDLYLQEAAVRMKRQLRGADMLARLGGDEFAALVQVVHSRTEVEEIALRLERCFDEAYVVDRYVLRCSASVGIAIYPEDATTADSLLSTADAAMYLTKHSKRQSVD